jgi:hypothetical protein
MTAVTHTRPDRPYVAIAIVVLALHKSLGYVIAHELGAPARFGFFSARDDAGRLELDGFEERDSQLLAFTA